MEHRCISNDRVVCLRSHTDGSTIYQNRAVCDGLAQDLRIGVIMQGYLAPCALVQFLYNLLGSRIERVLDVKYVNFCHAV